MPVPSIDREAAEQQTLVEIREWHRDILDALVAHRASMQWAIRSGSAIASRFVGMTEADIDVWYDARRSELDRLTIFNLTASAEATLKIDYFRRVGKKLKDPLSVEYRKWHKSLSGKKQLRPDFDTPGMLDILKKSQVMDNAIIGRYRECLQVRHWVGHGRYWAKPAVADRLDPDEVYERAELLLNSMPK